MTKKTEKPTLTAYGGGGSGEKSSPVHIYTRYAMGDMLKQISSDHGMDEVEVLDIIRANRPKEYPETKGSREDFEHLRVQRQLNLCDALNLAVLEMAGREPALMRDTDFAAHIARLTKVLANRHALNEGKVTEIVGITEMLTDEEMRRRMQDQDEAGDGLAVDDIGEIGSEE